ncbi:MAG TPA: (deoxy)nucleoside triphosphate pyrophosphohydrolase [Steroidobacteraceae bacterium]|nr:(deoxy)nucleoside triphosphate pyrophosphohydrolase [Steroidobacteraceae bacterium]
MSGAGDDPGAAPAPAPVPVGGVTEAGGGSAARPVLRVVAAALVDARGVLIAQRPPGRHMAGRWEFPGGKLAAGESERAALARELREELGIEVRAARFLMSLRHRYPDRTVELSCWLVSAFEGEPRALDGQQLQWVRPAALPAADILEADRPFVEALVRLLQ